MAFEPRVIGETKGLDPEVLKKLELIAKNTGKNVNVISGVDTRKYLKGSNKGKSKLTAHECKIAADIQIEGMDSEQIATELENAGFSGVGRYYFKDGTPTHTAHGDLRGLPVAKGTKFERGLEKEYKWGYKWYLIEGKHYGKSIDWLHLDGPPHPKPAKAKPAPPAEAKAAPPTVKTRPPVMVNRTMLIAAIIAALAIIAVLVAVFISQSGTPAGDLVGTWGSSSTKFYYATDDLHPGTLVDVASEDRQVTWTITEGADANTVNIEQHFTYTNRQQIGAGGLYTPDFPPNFYTGIVSSSSLTVMSGDTAVGYFSFTADIITGTWSDNTWGLLYTESIHTASNGLTLTKQ